ncbi:MAG: YfhO family protein [Anaerolineae bacterium]|nr:YfhO family protein [Anaerolineae bacterium]
MVGVLHLTWAGLGMWRFTGALGVPAFGRGVSALAFAFTGYTVTRLGTPPMVDAAAWLPWLFWAVHRLTDPGRRARWRDTATLAGVVAMLLLAGHAQLGFYALVGAGCYTLWRAVSASRKPEAAGKRLGRAARRLGLALAGVALGAAIAGVQIAPTAELLHASQRAGGLDYDFVMNFSYGPLRALTLLTPHFFGSPADGSYVGKGAYWEDATYIGFLPFVLALLAVCAWRKRRRRVDRRPALAAVPFFAALGAGAFVLALGRYTPLYDFLYHNAPTFAMFQGPARWHLLTVFALSVLAGVGTVAWGRGRWTFFWCRLATAGGVGLAAMALLAPNFIPENAALTTLSAAVVALGSWLAGSAVLTLAQPDPEWARGAACRRWWQAAALLFIAVDLLWAWTGFNPTAPVAFYDPVAGEAGGRAYWFADYAEFVAFNDATEEAGWFRFNDFRVARDDWPAVRRSHLPNLDLLDRAPQLNNNDPMRPGEYVRYLELIEAAAPAQVGALLRAAGVSVVYNDVGPPGWAGESARYAAPEPAPRAWIAPEARWFPDRPALEAHMLEAAWDPAQTVLLEGAPPSALPAQGGTGTVSIIEDAHTTLRLRVEVAGGPAWLVLADTWYPGWEASIDGASVEALRANLAFRVVSVPPGAHEITFRYNPRALWAGALATAAGLAALAVLAFLARRQSASG